MSDPAITLHGTELSGHAHKVVLSCYSYVAAAPEGGISLDRYPSVRAWLRRIEGLPQFVPMPACPNSASLTSDAVPRRGGLNRAERD